MAHAPAADGPASEWGSENAGSMVDAASVFNIEASEALPPEGRSEGAVPPTGAASWLSAAPPCFPDASLLPAPESSDNGSMVPGSVFNVEASEALPLEGRSEDALPPAGAASLLSPPPPSGEAGWGELGWGKPPVGDACRGVAGLGSLFGVIGLVFGGK